jgi:hypothetical protein
MSKLENSDAVILMQFRDAVAPVLAAGKLDARAMESAARPYFDRLKANGHAWPDALDLMRSVVFEITKGGK